MEALPDLRREDGGVHCHVGPGFKDNSYYAQRDFCFGDAQTVGPGKTVFHLAHRVLQFYHLAHRVRHRADAGLGEGEPVDHRLADAGGPGGGDVLWLAEMTISILSQRASAIASKALFLSQWRRFLSHGRLLCPFT